ncbi:hypothetical protein JCM8547_003084 [Rhodosporidiobolus lusitaniae]
MALSAPSSPGGTSSSSNFLLLTTHPATDRSPLLASSPPSHPSTSPTSSPSLALPRPRFLWLLQLFCLVDFSLVLGTGFAVPLHKLPWSTLLLSLARPVFLLAVYSRREVRGLGVLIIGQVLVSLLVLLYRLNELVQTSTTSLSLSLSPSSLLSLSRPHLPTLPYLLNPTSRWYLLSFSLSLSHYILFALVIGVRRRRNPFAGRGVRGGTGWGEMEWEGVEEEVNAAGAARAGGRYRRGRTVSRASRMSAASRGGGGGGELEQRPEGEVEVREGEVEEEFTDDEEEDGSLPEREEGGEGDGEFEGETSSSEDEDDIIDIPRSGGLGGAGGTLRHRPSRGSILSSFDAARSPPSPSGGAAGDNRPGLRASRGFGSMRSLAGI